MTELERLNQDLAHNEELAGKLEAALKGIAERKEAGSDGEAMVKAAAELGYTISIADLERATAENELLDLDALTQVSGGDKSEYCTIKYSCYAAFLHPDGENEACFNNYYCGLLVKMK